MFRRGRARMLVHGPRPTARGWAIFAAGLVVLAAAATWGRQDLLLIGLALALLPLGSMMIVALTRPRLGVSRSISPGVIAAGDEATVSMTLTNPQGQLTASTAWRDLMPGGIQAQRAERLRLAGASGTRFLNGTGPLAVQHRVRANARGIYDIGPMVIMRRDPFGLAGCEYALGPVKQLVVTPIIDTTADEEPVTIGGDGSEHQVLRRTSPGADELIAREYRNGDPLRRVHWRATARLGELMVRQEEQRSNPEAWIVFDTRRAEPGEARHPLATDSTDATFERAVTLVASLGVKLINAGYRVNVLETGAAQLAVRGGSSRSGRAGGLAPAFEMPGGERSLLVGLAGIRQRRTQNPGYAAELMGSLHRAGGAVPVFAVILNEYDGMAASLAPVAAVSDVSVAFLLDAGAADLDTPLTAAGWHCVPFGHGAELGTAWRAARFSRQAVDRV
ncbi:DUF58 domain-containing protein [Leifsonia sp. Root112D2]|uniref:DUF58 domain-containing protein n=1 Tax=Leifsonia sp. Root112D2 TaxID=1736426 RepID=UPI0012FAED1F|nr:DUF58 domain-containing protein [Leifsonia sp. Root112D2]